MDSATNQAAILESKCAHPLKVSEVPMPSAPEPTQVIVKVHSVAVNPADAGIQQTPDNVAFPIEYPFVLGFDFGGEVVALGSDVTKFQVGDRIIGVGYGCFRKYLAVDHRLATRLPADITFTQGCTLPLALCTAASAIFEPANLGWNLPKVKPESNGQTVIIWGGASSVGSCAIQMAKAAGYRVAAIAGTTNQQYCRDIGADLVFDYKNPGVKQHISQELHGRPFAGVFDAIIDQDTLRLCAELAEQLGDSEKNKVVGTVLPPPMAPKESPVAGVRIATCISTGLRDTELGPAIWDQWLTPALANGSMLCKPEPRVVGKGLHAAQEAVDLIGKGVSASKLVVEIL